MGSGVMGKKIVDFDVPTLFRLWAAGLPEREISEALGIRVGSFYIVKNRYKLPERPRALPVASACDDPTPEEIAERAAEQRAKWSPEEEERRQVGTRRRALVRSYRFQQDKYVATALD
jgi:hypothetical protein